MNIFLALVFVYLFFGHIIVASQIPAPGEVPNKEIWKAYFKGWKEGIIWPYYIYKFWKL